MQRFDFVFVPSYFPLFILLDRQRDCLYAASEYEEEARCLDFNKPIPFYVEQPPRH